MSFAATLARADAAAAKAFGEPWTIAGATVLAIFEQAVEPVSGLGDLGISAIARPELALPTASVPPRIVDGLPYWNWTEPDDTVDLKVTRQTDGSLWRIRAHAFDGTGWSRLSIEQWSASA